jgi:carbon-monoxide dehydrogenase small subunit
MPDWLGRHEATWEVEAMVAVSMTVNGKQVSGEVEPRTLLVDFLRSNLGLTGTHVGCDTSQCGACVVHVDGDSVKSCTTLAVQAEGAKVTTIEGLAQGDELDPVQQAFIQADAFQCGFCTPGQIMSAVALLNEKPKPTRDEVRHALSGNLCRCGAYDHYLNAVMRAAEGGERVSRA